MEYPEHEKLKLVKDSSQTIGEFLDWLSEKHIELGIWPEESSSFQTFAPMYGTTEKLLAEYFNIDLKVLEAEKRSMLEECRKV